MSHPLKNTAPVRAHRMGYLCSRLLLQAGRSVPFLAASTVTDAAKVHYVSKRAEKESHLGDDEESRDTAENEQRSTDAESVIAERQSLAGAEGNDAVCHSQKISKWSFLFLFVR